MPLAGAGETREAEAAGPLEQAPMTFDRATAALVIAAAEGVALTFHLLSH